MVTIELLSITQVVGYIVVRCQLIGVIDAFVDKLSHQTVVFVVGAVIELMKFGLCNLVAEGDVHPALRLGDTRQDAVQVFARFLDIFGKARLVEFECFQDVA